MWTQEYERQIETENLFNIKCQCAGRNYRMHRMKASILKCRPLLNSALIVFNAIKFVMDARREKIIIEMLLLFRINFRNDLKGLKSKHCRTLSRSNNTIQLVRTRKNPCQTNSILICIRYSTTATTHIHTLSHMHRPLYSRRLCIY